MVKLPEDIDCRELLVLKMLPHDVGRRGQCLFVFNFLAARRPVMEHRKFIAL